MQIQVKSPNVQVRPTTSRTNAQGHLEIGGCDCTELAEKFGTPLWVMDEQTIRECVLAYQTGLSAYPNSLMVYAGKAFLSLALCHLLDSLGVGLDVVSEGELYTAEVANFPFSRVYLHGNNKTEAELSNAISLGAHIVVDNLNEISRVGTLATRLNKAAKIHLRLIPGIEPDTHDHIKTGHYDSKFGIPLEELPDAAKMLSTMSDVRLIGIHAHIGSQSHDIEPYLQNVTVLAEAAATLKRVHGIQLEEIDVGGGLGIAYTEHDRPMAIYEWARAVATQAAAEFARLDLGTPKLLVEPGRSIVGTAGVTLYRAGALKELPSGMVYLPVDGGMADNPRPITYQAKYTSCIANRVPTGSEPPKRVTLVGRYCESGDIIVKEANLDADSGDLIAIFGTGAYNYSMASNYNRSPRPACVLVANGAAEVIVERESNADLIRKDRVPERLLRRPHE